MIILLSIFCFFFVSDKWALYFWLDFYVIDKGVLCFLSECYFSDKRALCPFDCYVCDYRSNFCLIVTLGISALYFLFDCYVSDKRAQFSV